MKVREEILLKATINANGTEITVLSKGDENSYISLNVIARYKNPDEPKEWKNRNPEAKGNYGTNDFNSGKYRNKKNKIICGN